MNINIGAGYKKLPSFISIDNDPNCQPDILLNLDDPNLKLPFDDNSVQKVIAHHILEHIGDGYLRLIQELYRVCKHGAIIDIKVPHPFHEVYLNDPTHKRPITVEGLRLFNKDYNRTEIAKGGSSSTLGLMLDVDFEIVYYNYVYDSFYDDILEKLTDQERQRLLREAVNTTLEIEVLLAVKKTSH